VNNANGLTLNNGVLGLEDLLGRIYPVGTIYETTNPEFDTAEKIATQFGFGTWEAFGAGRVLVGISGDTEFDVIGETGGAKANTLATENLPAHTHSIPALTTGTESRSHSHTINHSHVHRGWRNVGGSGTTVKSVEQIWNDGEKYGGEPFNGSSGDASQTHTHTTPASTTGSTGSGTAINNIQPYIVVYRYIRTN
jgi:microcystin-dependent protein